MRISARGASATLTYAFAFARPRWLQHRAALKLSLGVQEAWETKSGQHMMWNGVFGALLFLNDHEYMGANRSAFFSNTSLPLLEGLLDWWACYLVKTPCSPPGTPDCPAGGYRYDDANDAVNEGSKTLNSQMGLAFVARLADILRRLPPGSSRSTAIAEVNTAASKP